MNIILSYVFFEINFNTICYIFLWVIDSKNMVKIRNMYCLFYLLFAI